MNFAALRLDQWQAAPHFPATSYNYRTYLHNTLYEDAGKPLASSARKSSIQHCETDFTVNVKH
jgi:hypothetical protein